MRDLIDREKLTIICYTDTEGRDDTFDEGVRFVLEKIDEMPNVTMEEFEWCHDCKEYDTERHCCPRWTKVIRQTVEEMKTGGYAPVRHGHWITDECLPGVAVCSVCGHEIRGIGCQYTKYCDECGAKMDEVTDDKQGSTD